MSNGLRIRVHATDPVRRRGLTGMLEAVGHVLTDETPDVELCDLDRTSSPLPKEAEAPVVALWNGALGVLAEKEFYHEGTKFSVKSQAWRWVFASFVASW